MSTLEDNMKYNSIYLVCFYIRHEEFSFINSIFELDDG